MGKRVKIWAKKLDLGEVASKVDAEKGTSVSPLPADLPKGKELRNLPKPPSALPQKETEPSRQDSPGPQEAES